MRAQGRQVRTVGGRRAFATLATTLALASLTACTTSAVPPPEPPTTGAPAKLTFGAFGTEEEIEAYTQVTDSFNSLHDDADAELEPYAEAGDLVDRIKKGEDVPDVFMVSRDDLAWLVQEGLTQPIDVLLDERGVDFGDGYSRAGLQAFSAEDRLQCMPYGISPRVVFYNTDMIDLDKLEQRGLYAPDEPAVEDSARTQSWTFDEFTAAAEYAARPRRKTRGVYVEPTLESLAPFIYSGGGKLFDDDEDPTSLAFSDGDTRDALERSLGLLRSPLVTPSQKELERQSPLEMFESGKLAMIQGYRELVPELRQVQGLEFDVMPMPTLDSSRTVGRVTGLCMSADTRTPAMAADLMVKLLSTESVRQVAHAGYLVPANLEVAMSDDFLQPGRLPAHAGVFNESVRSIVFPPLMTTWVPLERAVHPLLEDLLNEPLLDDLDALTEQIDEESRTVLDPAEGASESPEE